MLKKLMALAASTAMLGANAAAYAITSVRTAVKNVTGAGDTGEAKPASGTNIQPSIPPMPPEPEHKAEPRKTGSHSKAEPRKAGSHGKAEPRKTGSHTKAEPLKAGSHKVSAGKASAAKSQHAKARHRKTRSKSPAR